MRAPILFALITTTLSLAACGSADDAGASNPDGLSANEIAEIAEDAVRPRPGQYSSTVELVSIDMPGVPEEGVAMMKKMLSGKNATHKYCLTAEQAAKGYEEMARNSAKGDCKVETFDIDGGDMHAVMVCTSPDGSVGRMTLNGSGTSTSSDMTMTMETSIPGMGEGTMVMHAVNQRIGDCPA